MYTSPDKTYKYTEISNNHSNSPLDKECTFTPKINKNTTKLFKRDPKLDAYKYLYENSKYIDSKKKKA